MSKNAKAASSPRSKGKEAAARSEVNGADLTTEIRGVEVTLPANLPADFSLRYAKIAGRSERGQDAAGPLYELIVGVIGEKAYDEITDRVAEDGGEPVNLFEFVGAISEPYFVSSGESKASAES